MTEVSICNDMSTMSNNLSSSLEEMDIDDIGDTDCENIAKLTDSESQTLSDCDDFAYALLAIVDDVRKFRSTERQLPKFPRSELMQILGLSKPPKVLRDRELHDYLTRKIVSIPEHVTLSDGPLSVNQNASLSDILPILKDGYKILQKAHARVIGVSLDYGSWLNAAYKIFELNKGAGKVRGSWANWLKENVGISDSYARQLRELANKFEPYKKIQSLSVPFSELWKRKLEIEHMLITDVEVAEFWKQP